MASAYSRQLSDGAWLNQSIILPNLTQVGSKLPLLAMQWVSCYLPCISTECLITEKLLAYVLFTIVALKLLKLHNLN
ncbi:hypothetical protein ANSO36C_65010 (plasmid) [Nostoc cf. commune SO-36]|uniref:Uncharacterized protein n=1 Tax=Nostoc cf. commune SO-36 TaxID=449208 RepID=A0ABN6QE78_NOSCO|nr:hypothetical protein ANSO36C_65010 [Nostoc cf. commune SO-36]